MSFGIVASIAGPVIGGIMGSDAAGDAADAQAASAAQSDATQRYMYDTTRADNAPFLQNGTAASNRLAYEMGLDSGTPETEAQIRQRLQSQYTTTTPGTAADVNDWSLYAPGAFSEGATAADYFNNQLARVSGTGTAGASTVDEAGLNAAVQAEMQRLAAERAARSSDPNYGGLNRKFTMADRDADPVYQSGLQFGADQGSQGINRMAAAQGSMLSGATLKALTRFGNDYGSTKANDSYNRYNNDQTTRYNRLAGIAGSGQTASSQIGSAGQNMANNISASQIGAGNARASGYIAQSNSLQNGLNGAVSAWKNYSTPTSSFGIPPASAYSGYSGDYNSLAYVP